MAYNSYFTLADGPQKDAFSRLRVSSPSYVFDAQMTYDLQPLLYEAVTNGSGATVAHSSTNRNALMTFSSTPTGGKAYMQSYEHFRYQPGRSQFVIVTFNFVEGVANCVKFAGYSDGSNGIELQWTGVASTAVQLVQYSDSGLGDTTVTRANWDDPLDGTGPSGLTVDFTKNQIFAIDIQALYAGSVRAYMDISGTLVQFHEFENANAHATPYIQTANLPVRVGMTCTGTVSTTMTYTCCAVASEGGQDNVGGYHFSAEGTVTAGNNTRTHILSVRPKTTFNSITNRSKLVLDNIQVLVTGAQPVEWELCLGQAISVTTTYTDVNATYSGFEYNTAGTISGSPAIVLASGYVAASASSNAANQFGIDMRSPICLDAAGAVRANGTLSLIVTGLGGTSATRAIFNWKEIR